MSEDLTAVDGFDTRDWSEVTAILQRTGDRLTAITALVAAQAPLAVGMIAPMMDGILVDVRSLSDAWVSAERDLERLWPHLPCGLDED